MFVRLSGIAALGFVASVAIANVFLGSAGAPQRDAEPAEVADFFADKATAIEFASAFAVPAWLCLIVFGAGVVARARRSGDATAEGWSLVGLAGVVLQNALFCGVVATQLALLSGASLDGGLWQLHWVLFTINGISLATIMLGCTMSGLRIGGIARWHAGIGLLAAALLTCSALFTPVSIDKVPAVLEPIGLGGFLLWLVWVIWYGVTLVRDRVPESVPEMVAA